MKVAAAQASAMVPVNNIQEEAVHDLHTKNNNNITSNNNIGDANKKYNKKLNNRKIQMNISHTKYKKRKIAWWYVII